MKKTTTTRRASKRVPAKTVAVEVPPAVLRHLLEEGVRCIKQIAPADGDTPEAVLADYRKRKAAGEVDREDLPITNPAARAVRVLARYLPGHNVAWID